MVFIQSVYNIASQVDLLLHSAVLPFMTLIEGRCHKVLGVNTISSQEHI